MISSPMRTIRAHQILFLVAAMVAFVFSPAVLAQSPDQPTLPDPSQAPLILDTLDRDSDGKISRSEAPDDVKQSFAFIDSNGDGGIDLAELKRMLKMVAAQNRPGAPRGPGNPGFGTRNPDAASFMMVPPEEDGMFYMLNLIKYRDRAEYADGRETDLSGREADRLYNPMPLIQRMGGGLVYAGAVDAQLAGRDPAWDTVAIVMYPSRAKFQQTVSSPEFQETAVHKSAGLTLSQVIVTVPKPWSFSDKPPFAAKDIPYPATAQDQPFTFLHLVKYRDVAQYPAGSNEPERSGREAMALFWKSAGDILHEAGVTPMLKAEVDGVLIGDGRTWSDYRMLRFPSHRAYEEVLRKIGESDFGHHLSAAIEDEYSLQLKNLLDRTANSPSPGKVVQAGPQQSFDSSQAPFILSTLDTDKNGKISMSEAVDDMKANFSLIDSNGDGGIDLEELEGVLKMVAAQQGSSNPGNADDGSAVGTAAGTGVFDRVTHHETENDGVSIHYVTLGEGPVVLFVHGFPDFWYSWREQMAALSGEFKTVAMDTRASNKSGKPEGVENYTMPHLMSDVEAVIKDLGIDSVTLVGHDWGGAISWAFAMAYPQRVSKLVICNLTHPKGYSTVRRNATADQKANTQYITDFQTPGFEDRLTPQVLTAISAGNVSDEVRKRYVKAFSQSSVKGLLDYYRAAYSSLDAGPGGGPEMPSLTMPVLQFHGLKDKAVDKDGLRDTWNWVNADYTLVTIPDSDHWIQREAAYMVSNTMLWWLKSRP